MTLDRAASTDERLAAACAAIEALEPGDAFDPAIPQAIVATGLHAAAVPVEAGGGGVGLAGIVRILTAIGAIDGATALGLAMHLHVTGAAAGSPVWPPATLERLFRAVVDEGALVNAASTEEGGGSPSRGAIPGTVATSIDGGGRVAAHRGEDVDDVAAGAALRAGRAPAWTVPTTRRSSGTSSSTSGSPGVERLPAFEALGMRGSASGRLRLAAVDVPAEALVVQRAAGAPDPRGPAPAAWFAVAISAAYLGVGEGSREAVARWALDRRPGDGSSAVADIPTIQLRLGRMDATLRAARIVLEDVARRWDLAEDDAAQARARARPDAGQDLGDECGRHGDRGGAADRRRSRIPRRPAGTGLPGRPGRTHQPAPRRHRVDRIRTRRARATPVDSLA